MDRSYEIATTPDETEAGATNWMVTVPDFPEITTFADTQAAIADTALDAIEEAIAARIADGEGVPLPSRQLTEAPLAVQLPVLSYLKVALYDLCRRKGVSGAELGRRLGWHREQVDRLFRLDHNSRLDQMEAAFKAMGASLSLDVRELTPAA